MSTINKENIKNSTYSKAVSPKGNDYNSRQFPKGMLPYGFGEFTDEESGGKSKTAIDTQEHKHTLSERSR